MAAKRLPSAAKSSVRNEVDFGRYRKTFRRRFGGGDVIEDTAGYGKRIEQANELVDRGAEALGISHLRDQIFVEIDWDSAESVTRVVDGEIVIFVAHNTLLQKAPKRLLDITHEVGHAKQWFGIVEEVSSITKDAELIEEFATRIWRQGSIRTSRQYARNEVIAETWAREALRDQLPPNVIQQSVAYTRIYRDVFRRRGKWKPR